MKGYNEAHLLLLALPPPTSGVALFFTNVEDMVGYAFSHAGHWHGESGVEGGTFLQRIDEMDAAKDCASACSNEHVCHSFSVGLKDSTNKVVCYMYSASPQRKRGQSVIVSGWEAYTKLDVALQKDQVFLSLQWG